jgi:hypothetical protein
MSESQKEEIPVNSPTGSDNFNEDEPMPMPGSQANPSMSPEPEMVQGTSDIQGEEPVMSQEEGEMGQEEQPVMSQEEEGEMGQEEHPVMSQEEEGDSAEIESNESNESVGEETKPARAQAVLKKASNFRQKLTKTKRKLASLDDSRKEKIRSELVNEFVSILKLYKHKTTRKKYIRRLNGLRTAFNQSLNKLNGTTRQRKRKSKKQEPIAYSQEQEAPYENEAQGQEMSAQEETSGNPL